VGRTAINDTQVADWLVAPLLVPDTLGPADAIVVSGAGVIDDCVPNQNGVRRVLLAARLWRQGRAPFVVFMGGTGNGTCAVAVAMARLAIEVGVPASRVRLETASRSTWENGAIGAPLLRGWGVQRVLVVTDRLHMLRAASVFATLGFDVAHASVSIAEGHADNIDMLSAGAREVVALAYYWIRGWVGSLDRTSAPATPARRMEGTGGAAGHGADGATTGLNGMTTSRHDHSGPIVLLGASYAEGWPLRRVGDIQVVNRGVAGQQSFDMTARFDRDVVSARPRAVIIWGFINDVFRASPQEMDAALTRVRDNYTAMIAAARAHEIEPIIGLEVTMGLRAGWSETVASWLGPLLGKQSYQDGINAHVRATNAWLTDLAVRERLLVLDLSSALADEHGRRRRAFAQDDGSHITAAGYDMLTSYSGPILEAHFVKGQRGL
jgi:uncharacterized SAM-binding protein YcdF (DUF218 family)/lysophospholipase L1-like esterase